MRLQRDLSGDLCLIYIAASLQCRVRPNTSAACGIGCVLSWTKAGAKTRRVVRAKGATDGLYYILLPCYLAALPYACPSLSSPYHSLFFPFLHCHSFLSFTFSFSYEFPAFSPFPPHSSIVFLRRLLSSHVIPFLFLFPFHPFPYVQSFPFSFSLGCPARTAKLSVGSAMFSCAAGVGWHQWRNKVAVGPRASIPKGPPLPQKNF